MADHYFTAEPAATARRRRIDVVLAGRRWSLETAAGIFSPDHVDTGTQVLLNHAPAPPARDELLDLGCGWGPIALTLGLLSPGARVWGVDVNERSLDLARANAAAVGLDPQRMLFARPDDVPADLRFAAIWSNPPIRVGKAVLHDLLRTWLPRLEPGGTAYLVVQRNLGSDSLQDWITACDGDLAPFVARRYASSKGFRVLAAHRA